MTAEGDVPSRGVRDGGVSRGCGGWARRTAALLALGLGVAGCADTPIPPPPLPSDVRVTPPPADVPADHARYSGRWQGRWDGQMDHILVVELQTQNGLETEVVAVYAWGAGAALGVGEGGWSRVRGKIANGEMRLDLTRVQATAVYKLRPDGTLDGEYWRGSLVARVRLTRIGP